jgi:hypothetical protein
MSTTVYLQCPCATQNSEDITKEVGNVHYNMDKALESLVEAQVPKGFPISNTPLRLPTNSLIS